MVRWFGLLPLIGSICFSTAINIKQPAPVVPGAFIVELADGHDSTSFYNSLGDTKKAVKHRMNLDFSLFNGVSFQLQNVKDVDTAAERIARLDMVKQMWPVRIFSVPKDEVVWQGSDKNAVQASLRKRQSVNSSDTFSPHVMTQVDKLRADGVTGQGVRIGVIDTGVDYNHPALGGCFGTGCLISYGTDLVGDNYDGTNTPVPDADPYDKCQGHGTHVSGIIAAQSNSFNFTGAAPGVTLGAYRVFGCNGSAGNDVLIAAYNKAYQDGSQIITASIGGASGWTEEPWAVVVQRIVEAGVPCTVSAGNDGDQGLFYASTAANGKRVTAVASIDNTQSPMVMIRATYSTSNVSAVQFGWTEGSPANWGNVSLPLWAVSHNTSDAANGCNPYPADTPDLSGYIVLIKRGSCLFTDKAKNAAAHGAKRLMFYNNAPGTIEVLAQVDGIVGVGMVTADQGAEWVKSLASNTSVTLNIVDPKSGERILASIPNTATGGFLSTYTSWGPTFEVDVKPQVGAPGGLILSTFPLALGGYAVLSGTSMACPLTAAIFALISQVRKTLDPATIENLLSATSNPNLFHNGSAAFPYLAPVAQQGSGLIQAYDAAHSTTLLSVSSLSFNDTDHFVSSTNFTIKNLGSEDVTYSLSNVIAATGYTLKVGSIQPSVFPNELVTVGAKLEFSESKVTVPAGSSSTVIVTPTGPSGLDESRLPVYGGYITLNATNGESLSLPYLGVQGKLHNATILDKDQTYLTNSSDASFSPVPANSTFVVPRVNGTGGTTSYPTMLIALAMGSSLIRMDVVPQNSSNTTEVLGAKTLGNAFGFPVTYQPRGGLAASWDGRLQDGSFAPAGSYTLLTRTLKIFGDAKNVSDYESKESVQFNLRYK